MDGNYEYYAFISYKREDEKWAIWLQESLERYSIPASVRKDVPRLPKNIRPVFRDKTDLGAGGLSASLHKELECSKYLIVICSPNSASSNWVGDEIEYFRSLGREDNIIPFIVDGVPHSDDPSNECFHPNFHKIKDEPLGINVNELGKRQALIKVIAKLLDLRFDVLYDRHRRHTRKKRIITALLTTLVFIIGVLFWFYTKPTYKYYADYVDRWGVPEGIVELDKSQYEHRARFYRFEYHRIPFWSRVDTTEWRLTNVDFVNSAGQLQDYGQSDHVTRFATQKLDYDNATGQIKDVDYCNKFGKPILRWKYSSKDGVKASVVDFLGVTEMDASGYHTTLNVSYPYEARSGSKSPIKRYVLTRDDSGFITSVSYHESNSNNIHSSRITDINGIQKVLYENDSLGRVLTITYIGIDGEVKNRKDGVAVVKFEYDALGNLSTIQFFDSSGRPAQNSRLYAKVKCVSDTKGNIVSEQYYGVDGELCYDIDGVAQRKYEFDEHGFLMSIEFLDSNGLPCLCKDGYARILITCDKRGNQTKNIYTYLSGKLAVNSSGFSSIVSDFDRWGHPIYEAYRTFGGELVLVNGIAGRNAKFDRQGNITEYDFFDTEWNACKNNDGVAGLKAEYNERGDQVKLSSYDLDGELCLNVNGYAITHNEYYDNCIETTYFDVDGVPCNTVLGFHKARALYNHYGLMHMLEFFNKGDSLCVTKNGYAYCKNTINELGYVTQIEYFDEKGDYIACNGSEIIRYGYDERGRNTSVNFYFGDGRTAVNKDGISSILRKYDTRGNMVEESYVDSTGKQFAPRCLGYAKWIKEYDSRNLEQYFALFDEDDDLVSLNNGVAVSKYEYNDRGILIGITYYDENRNICLNKDLGYARYEAKYDDNCDQIEQSTYDAEGNLCLDPATGFARWVGKYDADGNKTEMLSYNANDSLCVCVHGYARWVGKYDNDGYLIKDYSYDEAGNVIEGEEESLRNEPEKEYRKYDSHRFKFDWIDVTFGVLFFVIWIILFVVWIKEFLYYSRIQHLLHISVLIVLLGFMYLYLRLFLLHYEIIPYDVYNYSWILNLLSSIIISGIIVYLFGAIVKEVITIRKKYWLQRKSAFKASLPALIFMLLAVIFLVFCVVYMLQEGWDIYCNPL